MTARRPSGKRSGGPRLLPVLLLISAVAAAGILTGCSGRTQDPRELLRKTEEKALEVSRSSTTLRMKEGLTMTLRSTLGDLEQRVELAGAMQMPAKEGYEYRETWSGSLVTADESPLITLSYVTLDGGKTAYVKGSQLEKNLGRMGWVYYTPPADDNRYFDYLRTVRTVTGYAEGVTLVGEEEINGSACWRLETTPSLDALVREQLDGNPAFREKYQDVEVGQNIVEVKSEIWISREGYFPVRIYNMMVLDNADLGEEITVMMQVDFSRYGEALELPVDAPAVYTKAE